LELNIMEFKKIRLSQESTNKLRQFKMRTGLTPNISCRLALSLSINDTNELSVELYSDDTGQEINRYTFLGDQEQILLCLFTQWCHENNVKKKNYYEYLHAHINRGVEMLSNRVKGLDGLLELLKNN